MLQKKAATGEVLQDNQTEKLKKSKSIADELAACRDTRQELLIAAGQFLSCNISGKARGIAGVI